MSILAIILLVCLILLAVTVIPGPWPGYANGALVVICLVLLSIGVRLPH